MDFFAELEQLQLKTPRIGSVRLQSINSDYNHNIDGCKNCYLLCNAVKNEDCMYGRDFYDNADCVDCDHVRRCTLCYECLNCAECWNCKYLQDCKNCSDCDFGYYLKGCKNCIGCVGLNQKEFCIFNKPYSKEDFLDKKKSLTEEEIAREFDELKHHVPRTPTLQMETEKCFGDALLHCKNAFYAFDCDGCQDSGYVYECKSLEDCFDIFVLEYSELCYECSSNYKLHNSNFCFMCTGSSNLEYCELVMNSKDCFGCMGLNHKEYCILNVQYSKEDYFKRVAEIKAQLRASGEYGKRFLPSSYPMQDTVGVWEKL
ncbi:MAG: hypothetical protein AAB606_00080 [Patescibacteria group bacterium]